MHDFSLDLVLKALHGRQLGPLLSPAKHRCHAISIDGNTWLSYLRSWCGLASHSICSMWGRLSLRLLIPPGRLKDLRRSKGDVRLNRVAHPPLCPHPLSSGLYLVSPMPLCVVENLLTILQIKALDMASSSVRTRSGHPCLD